MNDRVYANSTPRSNTLVLSVFQRWATSASVLCNGVDCPTLLVANPGDPLQLPPFSYATTVELSTLLSLQGGGSVVLEDASGLVYQPAGSFSTESPALVPVEVSVGFSAAWELANVSSYVVPRATIDLQFKGNSFIYQIHCSGIWPQTSYQAILCTTGITDILYTDVTAYAQFMVDPGYTGLTLDSPGLVHPTMAGVVGFTLTFGDATYSDNFLALEESQLVYSVTLGFPVDWTVPRNTQASLYPQLPPAAYPGWASVDTVARVILSFASSDPGVIAVAQNGTATLLSDYYQPVTITTTVAACDALPAQAFPTLVSPHVLANQDGGLDIGPKYGLPVVPQAVGVTFSVPVYLYASQPLRSYTVQIRFPKTLQALSCAPGSMQDSQCELITEAGPAFFQAVGSYLSSTLAGRVLVATPTFLALLDSLAVLEFVSPESRVYTAVVTGQARNFTVKLGVGGNLVAPGSPGVGSGRRRLLEAQVWGDTEGVGRFSSLSVQFLEEYLVYSQFPGDQRICVTVCQWITNLTAWQRRMLNPVSDPNLPPTPPTLVSRLFMLHVLVAKYHFLSGWAFVSNATGLSLSAQLTDLYGNLNPPAARVDFVLQSAANQGLVLPVVPPGVAAVPPLGVSVYADTVVPLTITEYTLDDQGLQAADRSFTFYPTGPFAYLTLQGAHYVPPSAGSLPLGPARNCSALCLDIQRFEGTFPLGLVTQEHGPGDAVTWSSAWVLDSPYLELVDQVVTPQPQWTDGLYSATQVQAGQIFLVSYSPPPETGGGVFVLTGVGPAVSIYAVPGENTTVSLNMTPGVHTLTATAYDTLNASCPPASLVVQGLTPVLTGIQLVPGCTWLVRWSVLGGRDETCPASVYAIYSLGAAQPVAKGTCTPDGCSGAYRNQTVTALVDGYTPFNLALLAATQQLGVGQRTSWAALADLYSQATGAFVGQAAVTRQAFSFVQVIPPGALLVTARYIQALRPGRAAVYLGDQALAFNLSTSGSVPLWLELLAFQSVSASQAASEVNATLSAPDWAAGTSNTLLVYAWYPGQYRVQLTPADGVTLALYRQISTQPLAYGWLLSVTAYAQAYSGTLVSAGFRGATGFLQAAVQPPEAPLGLYVCCDLVATFTASPAVVFYPTQFTLVAQLLFQDSERPVSLADLTVTCDPNYLQYSAGTWRVALAVPYTGYVRTPIRLAYTQPGTLAVVQAAVTVTIVDVREFSVQTYFPQGSPLAARALSRLQCTQEFQRLRLTPQALVDGVGYLSIPVPDPGFAILVFPPGVAYVDGLDVVGLSPGVCTVVVEWYGYERILADVQILDTSVTVVSASSPPYVLDGFPGQSVPLELTLEFLGADGYTLFNVSNIFDDPLHPQFVQVVTPPSVRVDGPSLVLVGNSAPGDAVRFLVTPCPNATQAYAALVVLVRPSTGDVALTGDGRVLLNASRVEGFYLELATDWNITECVMGVDWRGPWACTLHDPPGIIRVTGVGTPVDGLVELAVFAPANASYALGWIELAGQAHTRANLTAAAFGQPGPWPIPWPYHASMPLLDITGALREFRCAMALACPLSAPLLSVLVLAHQQRIVDSSAFYSDDLELSLLLRLLDANGDPAPAADTLVYALVQTTALPPLAGTTPLVTPLGLYMPAPYIQDGWFGLEWRESLPVLPNTSVAWGIQTLDAYNDSAPTRLRTLGAIPYPPFGYEPVDRRALLDFAGFESSPVGVRQPRCPRSANFPAVVVNHYTAQVAGRATLSQLATLRQRVACAVSAVSRRVTATQVLDALYLSVATESFMRSYQTNFIALDPTSLAAWLGQANLTLLGVTREPRTYTRDPADPWRPCLPGSYFSETGDYLPIPTHATAAPDCYSFACDPGYEFRDYACIPASVSDDVYWVVVSLVALCVVVVVATAIVIRRLVEQALKANPLPTTPLDSEDDEDSTVGLLPVDADGQGNLIFEAEIDSSDASDDG